MAITDIQISEELETNAPSIKYKGSEGPKSPEEEQLMVDMEQIAIDFKRDNGWDMSLASPEVIIKYIKEWKARQNSSTPGETTRGPVLPSPEDPINPFAPKPIGPVLPDRQMAARGGIMGADGRTGFLFGGIKKRIRKLIPNEVAEIAVKAAPFVAPFNPLAAAAMSGLGSFDQTGRIGSSLKSGLMTYGLGQGARYLGGADFQGLQNPFTRDAFSMPTGSGGIKELFKSKQPADISRLETVSDAQKASQLGSTPKFSLATGDAAAAEFAAASNPIIKAQQEAFKFTDISKMARDALSKAGLGNNLVTGLLVGGLGAGALMGNMTPDEIQDMNRGEGMDVEGIRQEVLTAMKDPTGEALKAIRVKYPFLGRRDTKDLADGGRIKYDNGGITKLNEILKGKIPPVKMPDPMEQMLQNMSDEERTLFELKMKNMDKNFYRELDLSEAEKEKKRIQNEIRKKQAEEMGLPNFLQLLNQGGRVGMAEGGLMDLGGMEKDYRAEGGFVPIGREEKADDVPARLSVNEFVFTADAVRNAGGGDIDKGAEVMENMMKNLEAGGRVSEESQGMAGAQQMFETSERLSEVI